MNHLKHLTGTLGRLLDASLPQFTIEKMQQIVVLTIMPERHFVLMSKQRTREINGEHLCNGPSK